MDNKGTKTIVSNPTISFTETSIHNVDCASNLRWVRRNGQETPNTFFELLKCVWQKKQIKKKTKAKTNLNTVERMKNVSDKNHQTSKIKNTGFVIMA